jgi:lipid II:glycine glycyltransferase (peptidoglycan interpeptide bridge formation enzyme)
MERGNRPGVIMGEEYTYNIDDLGQDDWPRILDKFADSSLYQTFAYGLVRWGKSNISHCLIRKGEDVVAACQLVIRRIPLLGIGVAYAPWGPLWQLRGEPSNQDHLTAVLKCLREEYGVRRGLIVRVAPAVPQEPDDGSIAVLEGEGFKRAPTLSAYRTLKLDLSPDLEQIRKNLLPRWRRFLNQAEKNDIEITVGTGNQLYDTFLKLQEEMQERKKYWTDIDYDEHGKIQYLLEDQHKSTILIASHGGSEVCSLIFSCLGDQGIYLLGASANEGMNLRVGYLLQWKAIELLKERGCRWYDLGGIDPDTNPGGYQFKSGISKAEVQHIGFYEYYQSPTRYVIFSTIDRLRQWIREARGS